jgi:pimeloyl-ACP methyl ester carboxylesterase
MARAADTQEMTPHAAGPGGMVVERHGGGPPILLVHGLGGPLMWEKLVPLLSTTHEVIVPHLPGFGESPAFNTKLTYHDHARLLTDFLRQSGLTNVIMAGISYGGSVAAITAAETTGIIHRLVLICPTGLGTYPGLRRFGKITRFLTRCITGYALSSRWLSDRVSRRSFNNLRSRPPDLVDRVLSQMRIAGHVRAFADAFGEIATQGQLIPSIAQTLPEDTIIVWGEHDRILPPENTSGILASGGRFNFVRFPECGHSVPMEEPVRLSNIIMEGGSSSPLNPDG